ncbi:uncharacterized protein LOC106462289 [Limulus polyphemus]|uniref:Uncharacterized protein LOC106462289 n=1 Tax=Limulus polyphemus TaxID=6850 RepID=A0ABM1B9N3_LIMPO|nr:uncharacterized protein LOC106462289 [Limulus polyphemus]
METLKHFRIPIKNCRGHGYDNAPNMSCKYNGTQQHILAVNPSCISSPCACHTLILYVVDSASCCTEAVTFFGVVQTVYNLFSSSSLRWAIFKEHVDESFQALSGTRWTDRVASVRPFTAHLVEIRLVLKKLLSLNLMPKTINEVNGVIKYVSSFICILMSSMWLKILVQIDRRNQIIQVRDATVDVEVSNSESLLTDLDDLRGKWPQILNKAKLAAEEIEIEPHPPSKRKVKKEQELLSLRRRMNKGRTF